MSPNNDINALSIRYKDFLLDNGIKLDDENTGKDEDGDFRMVFKFEGLTFICYLDSADTEFVRILLPNFYSLDDKKERQLALLAITTVAKKCKGAKVFFSGKENDDVVAAMEYLDKGDSVDSKLFLRYVSMVSNAAREFANEMKSLKA